MFRVAFAAIAFSGILVACSGDPEDFPADSDDAGARTDAVDATDDTTLLPDVGAEGDGDAATPPVTRWLTAYYPGYKAADLPPNKVEFAKMTHLVHFALIPRADASLNATANNLGAAQTKEIVQLAHAAGKKILISIGGAVPKGDFEAAAATPQKRTTLVANLVSYVVQNGYDGIDLDWEPIPEPDLFQALVPELDAALAAADPKYLLSCASPGPATTLAPVAKHFDQLNIMTYDVSGPYSQWITWFNSPISAGTTIFPSTGKLVPAIDSILEKYVQLGVPPSKLGLGAPFYGYIWTGGTGTSTGGVSLPRQPWTTAPKTTRTGYANLLSQFAGVPKQWDPVAKVPYFSIDKAGSADDQFVSFDDEQAMKEKADFVIQKGYGGVIVWELEQGYFPENPNATQQPLLTALAQGLGIK
ncbi:MAG: glycoside hydrolase family 18 protein [Polyangiaceae bacterium]|nr:glycoside hydrolase family 18 protein [Polyangiaceae bacterium]